MMQAHHRDRYQKRQGGLSASRWQPPARRQPRPDSSSAPVIASTSRSTSTSGGGGGRWGGSHGKENNRERRRSSDDGRGGRRGGEHQHQRPAKKIVAPDEPSSSASAASRAISDDAAIPRLDPSVPEHARRLRQRRRQILFGKNTAGYEEYAKKVPRHRRRIRSPDCPMTPDHTLDIPAKRWQGLVNAWRRGLHKYDPPDLHLRQPAQDKITLQPRPCATEEDRQQEEIAMAKAAGLQVAFGGMNVGGKEAGLFTVKVGGEEDEGMAAMSTNGGSLGEMGKSEEVPFEEEAAYRRANEDVNDGEFLEEGCDEDSDDDIL